MKHGSDERRPSYGPATRTDYAPVHRTRLQGYDFNKLTVGVRDVSLVKLQTPPTQIPKAFVVVPVDDSGSTDSRTAVEATVVYYIWQNELGSMEVYDPDIMEVSLLSPVSDASDQSTEGLVLEFDMKSLPYELGLYLWASDPRGVENFMDILVAEEQCQIGYSESGVSNCSLIRAANMGNTTRVEVDAPAETKWITFSASWPSSPSRQDDGQIHEIPLEHRVNWFSHVP